MKSRIFHLLAGLSLGLVCYALCLQAFVFFAVPQHQTAYWLSPDPTPSFAPQLQVLWQFHRGELIAVLVGAPLPLNFSILGWWMAGRHPLVWLGRWYVQLAFVGVGLAALLFVHNLLDFILPSFF